MAHLPIGMCSALHALPFLTIDKLIEDLYFNIWNEKLHNLWFIWKKLKKTFQYNNVLAIEFSCNYKEKIISSTQMQIVPREDTPATMIAKQCTQWWMTMMTTTPMTTKMLYNGMYHQRWNDRQETLETIIFISMRWIRIFKKV